MAASRIAGWAQQVMLLTSLLANTSDFAAVDTAKPMAPTSLTTFQAQVTVAPTADIGANLIANIDDPNATDAQSVCPGYLATQVDFNNCGFTAQLSLLGEACNVYGTDIQDLVLTVEHQAKTGLHVNIQPAHVTSENRSWYILEEGWVPAPQQEGCLDEADLMFSWTNTPSFGFNVTRKSSQEVIFSTDGSKLIYENQFIEFVTSTNDDYNLYGLGEVIHGIRLQPGLTRTIYAADAGDPVDANIYGSHPFYLETRYYDVDPDNSSNETPAKHMSTSHGVYLRNAHAQEVLMHETNVTWRTLGGDIDLYFFSGPTQPEVTSQYLHQIGLPVMQQYWTLGFHQCRWGYENWSMTEEVVDNFGKFEIPLETIWNDIDYMKGYRDFENDPVRFPYDKGKEFSTVCTRMVFTDGNDTGSFMLNPDGTLYIGEVWPGFTVFPDFLKDSTSKWWLKTTSDWYKKIQFDGLWIDMNEVSSFCVGSCGSNNLSQNPVHPAFKLPGEPGAVVYEFPEGFNITNATEAASAGYGSSTQAAAASKTAVSSSATKYLTAKPTPGERDINHPPYVINHVHGDLAVHTTSPNATHHGGIKEYDVHNLYGHMLLQNTYKAMTAIMPGKRPFIIGRSTFVGSGNYSGHWGGDNYSKFAYMFFSIPQALSFSLFGIPMFGVDTCGFSGNADEELCNRWMQLSAFFPFYRNHNVVGALSQEPYVWESVIEATKAAMNIRFQLLPYMYTLFYYAHVRGDTVMRALAWEFPNDPSLANADRQFFLGSAILVTPVLTQGQATVDGVFPGLVEGTDVYYDWYNQSAVNVPSKKNTTIDAPLGHIPVYIRGGNILATQQMRMTTRDARKTDWSMIVAMGKDERANGTLYLDDGVSIEPESTKLVTMSAQTAASKNAERKRVTHLRIDVFVDGDFTDLDLPLGNVTILGVAAPPDGTQVKIDDWNVTSCVEYCAERRMLVISDLKEALNGTAWKKSWSLTL
ncbi:hypothetical protein PMZ80_010620 [Knufia obscura]|uniref:alpha-glucosidase n=1 Tax=Knufia obscura TaxID=1635080 RepID=A0ABR0R903_9EURO|nr:hypothetical protein PMZ80_010620 [Knufia obscura]